MSEDNNNTQSVADTDIKDRTNLLNDGDTIQDVGSNLAEKNGEVLTQVTSIAQEEKRTGQTINMPSPEELVARASSSLIAHQQIMNQIITRNRGGDAVCISRKGMNRVLNAIFSLPTEGVPVKLKGNAEKAAYITGQKLIRDMFIIMADHAHKAALKAREEKELTNQESSANVEQPNEGGQ